MLPASGDIFSLITSFQANPLVAELPEFQLLERVFRDQCQVSVEEKIQPGLEFVLRSEEDMESSVTLKAMEFGTEDEATDDVELILTDIEPKVAMIPPKDISSGSLQNPSDPDAAYSGHKGQGYQAQIVETYTPTDSNIDADEPHLNLITLVKVEPANESDSAALQPAIDELVGSGLTPEQLTADTAYGGDDNWVYANSNDIELLSIAAGNKSETRNGKDLSKLTADDMLIDKAQTASFANESSAWPQTCQDESEAEQGLVKAFGFYIHQKWYYNWLPNGTNGSDAEKFQ